VAEPVAVALIGVSGFADRHYRDLLDQVALGRVRLVAATVINPAEETEKCAHLRALGCTLHTDLAGMLAAHAGAIALCVIPTGIHLHAPMTIAALRAGANVLVEKPAAATIQDVRAMQAAEAASRRFVAVGFQNWYSAELPRMKAMIAAGRLGRIRAIAIRCRWPRRAAYYQRNAWAGRLRLGEAWVLDSPISNAVAHQLNQALFLAGASARASAQPLAVQAELYRAYDIGTFDTASLRVETAEGIPVLMQVSHACADVVDPEIVVRGERGLMRWTFTGTRCEPGDGPAEDWPTDSGDDLRRRLYAAVLARISDPAAAVCDLAIAGAHTLVVNGAHECGAVIALPPELRRHVATSDGESQMVIAGIDAAIDRAFTEDRLFSEIGVPWARPARRVELAGYERFPRDGAVS